MILKINSVEYLKRVDNMTATEKDEYLKRVGEWVKKQAQALKPRMDDDGARFQNAIQCSAMWNDAECQAWTEGALLLTPLAVKYDTWLPDQLYTMSARRAIIQMRQVLMKALANIKDDTGAPRRQPVEVKEEPGVGTERVTQVVTSQRACPPVRPKHIDQYVHLLPQATQEKAAKVKGLLTELDVARENARRLMEAGEHADKIAQWAKMATTLDTKVKAIYQELDAEWEKLVKSGRVVVDDFGNAHVVEQSDDTRKKPGRPPMTEEAKKAQQEKRASEKKQQEDAKRREYLKKWLRDTRTKPSDERKKQWEENCKELLDLGGEITDSISKAGEFYGVDIVEIKEIEGDKGR